MNAPTRLLRYDELYPNPAVAPSGGCCWADVIPDSAGHPSHPPKPGAQAEPWLTALSAVTKIPVRDLVTRCAQIGLRSLEQALLGESGVENIHFTMGESGAITHAPCYYTDTHKLIYRIPQ